MCHGFPCAMDDHHSMNLSGNPNCLKRPPPVSTHIARWPRISGRAPSSKRRIHERVPGGAVLRGCKKTTGATPAPG
ncbi:hypothetical protein HaLaN_08590 [Haematococcus lacustris]|uniref:Uncharacterized protein n=1 Tax=Haematococcus lacustris TaxID=44745 RepID=A0A699ZBH6_HAELA|nr:hypothetical protein HaLaN_08590 [Haematococcus lacustris]